MFDWNYLDGVRYRIHCKVNFFKTLWNHRAIIEKLEEEKKWIEDNAVDIINLVAKNEVSLTIVPPEKMFGYLYRLVKFVGIGKVQAIFKADYKIVPVEKIEEALKKIKNYVKKETNEKRNKGEVEE